MLKHLKSINLQDFHLNSTQLNSMPEKKEINYLETINFHSRTNKHPPTSPGVWNFYWFCEFLRAFNWKMNNSFLFMCGWADKKPTSRRWTKIANKSFSFFSRIIKKWFMQSLSWGFLICESHINGMKWLQAYKHFTLLLAIINFLEDHKWDVSAVLRHIASRRYQIWN